MEDNRVKPVSPSPARLKYATPRKKSNTKKKHKEHKDSIRPDGDNGNVIDEFA